MTRDQAARILHPDTSREAQEEMDATMDDVNQACVMGAEALRRPWIKTADRLPTQEDADKEGKILAWSALECEDNIRVEWWANVGVHAEDWTWWMPIPPLPEVDNQ